MEQKHLCKAFEPTAEQKLDQLLATTTIGDRRLTALIRELEHLVAGMNISDVVRRVFTCSLPLGIATAIAGNTSASLSVLCKAADQAWTRMSGKASATSAFQMVASIARSTAAPAGNRGRGGRQRNSRQQSATANDPTGQLCPYHAKFGESAPKCLASCSLWARRGEAQHPRVFHVECDEDEQESPAPEN